VTSAVIRSLKDYLDALGSDTDSSVHGNLSVFRGQRDATWSLRPSIVRSPTFDPKRSLARDPSDPKDKSAERRLLIVFRDQAVTLLPEWTWTGSPVEVNWKQVLIATHYRLPTRLLDWSTNPLVALYFAVEGRAEACSDKCSHPRQDADDGEHRSTVFVLKGRDSFSVSSLAAANPKPPIYIGSDDPGVIRPPAIDKRIVAQSGLFTISKDPAKTVVVDATLYIKAKDRKTILHQLDVCGVNHKTMFPDLEHLGEYLQWSVPRWQPNACN